MSTKGLLAEAATELQLASEILGADMTPEHAARWANLIARLKEASA